MATVDQVGHTELVLPMTQAMELLSTLMERRDALEDILRSILNDATGDLDDPSKRLWPIRADNYRVASKLLSPKEE